VVQLLVQLDVLSLCTKEINLVEKRDRRGLAAGDVEVTFTGNSGMITPFLFS